MVFWLFTRALFDETFRLRWWHALIWAAVAAFSFVNCMWIAPASGARLSIIAINLLALGFIVLAVAQTITSWSADLVERRRRVRVFIVSAAALYGGLNAVLQIAMSGSGGAEIANTVNSAVLAAVVAAICYAMMRVDGADLFPAAPEVQADSKRCGGRRIQRRRPETDRCADAADGATSASTATTTSPSARWRPSSGSPNTGCGG